MTSGTSVAPASEGPAPPGNERARWAVLLVLSVTLLMISMDNTVLNIALPDIVRDLGATSTQLQWTVDAYALVFAGLLLPLGALGDRVGRRWTFLAGLTVFGGGSAFAAFAGSPWVLTAARAVMGLGAAALMPATLSILTNVFTGEAERARAIGIWSGTAGIGVALGPILGGVLLSHFWWGSVFLINVPVAVIGLAAGLFLVPNSKNPSPGRPDPAGAILSMAGLVLVVWAIIEAPNEGWGSPLVIGALVGGIAILVFFALWEIRSTHPMLPMQFFRDRRFSVAILSLGLAIFALMGMFFLITQYLQFALGYSPLATGIRISPVAVTVLVIAPLAVVLARRLGMKPVVGTGMALVATALGLLSQTSVTTTYRDVLPAFLLIAAGVALTMSPSVASVMGSLPIEKAGVGSATNDTAMQVGGALGVGVLGSALAFRYKDLLGPPLAAAHVPESIKAIINGSLGGALAVAHRAPPALAQQLEHTARAAFISGMDLGLTIATGVAAGAALLAILLLPNRALGRR